MPALQLGQTALMPWPVVPASGVCNQGGEMDGAVRHLVDVEYFNGWGHRSNESVPCDLVKACGTQALSFHRPTALGTRVGFRIPPFHLCAGGE